MATSFKQCYCNTLTRSWSAPSVYVHGCCLQGTYQPAVGGQQQEVATNSAGRFSVATPVLATYSFASSGPGSCVDAVTEAPLAFHYTLMLPPLANATVTAIALLTVPARADAGALGQTGAVPAELWTEAYGMFGHQADAQVGGSKLEQGDRSLLCSSPAARPSAYYAWQAGECVMLRGGRR